MIKLHLCLAAAYAGGYGTVTRAEIAYGQTTCPYFDVDYRAFDMFRTIPNSLEDTAAGIEKFDQRIQDGFVALGRSAAAWTIRSAIRVKDYCVHILRAIVRLVIALSKLALFYLPSALCWWFDRPLLAFLWLVAVTVLGLFYRQKRAEGVSRRAGN